MSIDLCHFDLDGEFDWEDPQPSKTERIEKEFIEIPDVEVVQEVESDADIWSWIKTSIPQLTCYGHYRSTSRHYARNPLLINMLSKQMDLCYEGENVKVVFSEQGVEDFPEEYCLVNSTGLIRGGNGSNECNIISSFHEKIDGEPVYFFKFVSREREYTYCIKRELEGWVILPSNCFFFGSVERKDKMLYVSESAPGEVSLGSESYGVVVLREYIIGEDSMIILDSFLEGAIFNCMGRDVRLKKEKTVDLQLLRGRFISRDGTVYHDYEGKLPEGIYELTLAGDIIKPRPDKARADSDYRIRQIIKAPLYYSVARSLGLLASTSRHYQPFVPSVGLCISACDNYYQGYSSLTHCPQFRINSLEDNIKKQCEAGRSHDYSQLDYLNSGVHISEDKLFSLFIKDCISSGISVDPFLLKRRLISEGAIMSYGRIIVPRPIEFVYSPIARIRKSFIPRFHLPTGMVASYSSRLKSRHVDIPYIQFYPQIGYREQQIMDISYQALRALDDACRVSCAVNNGPHREEIIMTALEAQALYRSGKGIFMTIAVRTLPHGPKWRKGKKVPTKKGREEEDSYNIIKDY